MKNILCLILLLVMGLLVPADILADDLSDDYLGSVSSGMIYTPGMGYRRPPMGGPVVRYYYDARGRTHLVEVNPYTLEVKRSPVDLNRVEAELGKHLER